MTTRVAICTVSKQGRLSVLTVQVDMVEIYNEELRDLLAPINGKQRKQQSLQIKVRTRLFLALTKAQTVCITYTAMSCSKIPNH